MGMINKEKWQHAGSVYNSVMMMANGSKLDQTCITPLQRKGDAYLI